MRVTEMSFSVSPFAPDAEKFELARQRDAPHRFRLRLVGIDDRGGALRQQRVEQPELGLQIVVERRDDSRDGRARGW